MDPGTIAARLLYRDALMLVIDKPAGIAVHRDGRGAHGGPTLTDLLDELRFGLPRRPEVAHRLDSDTSGCLVLGRHRAALARLGRLFADGRVEKTYWAIVAGGPSGPQGEIDLPLARLSPDPRDWRMRVDPAGLPSRTSWRILGRAAGRTWLELRPLTGRTHQLRVHCAQSGWPILGDRVYGPSRSPDRLHLHACRLAVPLYPKRPAIVVVAPLPDHLRAALAACGWREDARSA